MDPAEVEALEFVVSMFRSQGRVDSALELLERAVAHRPSAGELLRGLGIAYREAGQPERAYDALSRALQQNRDDFLSRLLLGELLERFGHSYGALTHYFGALVTAQLAGFWHDDASTDPNHRGLVVHAMRYASAGRARLFSDALTPLRSRHGAAALGRVERALAMYLGDLPAAYQDDRQRPMFLFFPDLHTHPYFDRTMFPWVAELESSTGIIREEVARVLTSDDGIEPFHGNLSGAALEQYVRNPAGRPGWNSFFFYRHGTAFEANAARCPATKAALDQLPLTRIRDHAPESMFSVLTPGTEIRPHRGVTNTRLVGHLPLIVPGHCALNVGGETHVWQEGQVVVFDDTFEHEAWNRSEQTRVVLIFDIWNPYLDEAERDALMQLVPAIGDFNRNCGL